MVNDVRKARVSISHWRRANRTQSASIKQSYSFLHKNVFATIGEPASLIGVEKQFSICIYVLNFGNDNSL